MKDEGRRGWAFGGLKETLREAPLFFILPPSSFILP